jgi:predicted 3-demethylubiquinone-9 3-methyltransferase (glyoxalase superfamily)
MTTITTFLMFTGRCEEAVNFYVSLFGGAIVSIDRYGKEGPGPEGTVRRTMFTLADQTYSAIDSPAKHAFDFTPSMSLFVECADEAELDRLFAALNDGGQQLMPPGNYGFSRKFTWLNDRFGVSWQLNFA